MLNILNNYGALLSSIGLFLDIVGAILIFIYGLASSLSHAGAYIANEPSEEEEIARYNMRSRIGLALLILGFTFQLISNFIPVTY